MKGEPFSARLRRWLNNLPIQNPIERRIASLLQVVLIGLIVVVMLATIVLVTIPTLSVQEKLNGMRSNLLGFLVVALPLSLLRRGYFLGSALIVIIILFITPTLAVTVTFDLLNSGGILFQFTLAIILAGLLVSRRALALTFGLSAAVVVFAAFRGQNLVSQLSIAVNFILFNGLIALFVDRFGITLRTALTDALEREAELQSEISERRRAEEQIRYQASLLSNINDAIIASDENNRITAWNSAAELMYGWKAEEVLGQIGTEIVKTGFDELTGTDMLSDLTETGKWRGQLTQAHKDGSRFHVETAAITLRDAQGKITGYVSVNRDITARKQAEQKIQRQNQRLKVLREIDTAILAAHSAETIVRAALDHIRELIDCRRASLLLYDWETNEGLLFDVRTVDETSIPQGIRVPQAPFQDVLQTLSKNQPVLIKDLSVLADPPPVFQNLIKEGLRSLCILPLLSQDNLIGAFNMSSDIPGFFDEERISLGREVANQVAIAITQSRLVEALQHLNLDLEQRVRERENLITELTAKNAELEQFTYTVSHDLKSPLVTMKGFLGYLEQDAVTGNVERLKGDTKRIANAVDKMSRLLDDLLELSRIGRFVNPPEIVPFEELAREAIELAGGRIQEHGVAVSLQPNLPAVYGDRRRLMEVLQNLLDNATKYMGDQSQPRIEIGQRNEEVERGNPIFFVRDNGIGIAPEYHERVFGLFNKLDGLSEARESASPS